MSKWRIAVAGVAAFLLMTLLPSEAPARVRIGINPVGVAKMAVGRVLSLGRVRHPRSYARYSRIRTAALRPQELRKVMASGGIADPAARRQVVAVAALAGLRSGVTADGWWRHSDGGFGWVGSLYWPFAIYDIHDYAILGDDDSFWNYGYSDIYAAIFTPYGRADLAAYTEQPRPSGRNARRIPSLQQLCGDDSRDVGRLVGQIQQTIQPNSELQRAAMDDLTKAMFTAAQIIRSSCPIQAAFTAPERLAVMQQRIGTMIAAQQALQDPLVKFYDLLEDEQDARLIALAADRNKAAAANEKPETPGPSCEQAQPTALQWPAAEIEARLKLNDGQREALKALQEANGRAAVILDACAPTDTTTPPARIDAVDARLNAMQQAVYLVSVALGEFYATLSDEQKMQFEAIGQKRTA
jgi:LTXXQ motif family protein